MEKGISSGKRQEKVDKKPKKVWKMVTLKVKMKKTIVVYLLYYAALHFWACSHAVYTMGFFCRRVATVLLLILLSIESNKTE